MELKFRRLYASELEVRVQSDQKRKGTGEGVSLLIYKDARVDQRLLDDVVGCMNWQKTYNNLDGELFCTISIWDDEKGQWIAKEDLGSKSKTEPEKGRASDAQKRAAFAWGIGRELYTAPFVWIEHPLRDKQGNPEKYNVSRIDYNDDGVITALDIYGQKSKAVVWSMGKKIKAPKTTLDADDNEPSGDFEEEFATETDKKMIDDLCKVLGYDKRKLLTEIGYAFNGAQLTKEDVAKCTLRLKEISEARNGD